MLLNFELKGNEYLLLSYICHKCRLGSTNRIRFYVENSLNDGVSMSRATMYRAYESLVSKGYINDYGYAQELTKKVELITEM